MVSVDKSCIEPLTCFSPLGSAFIQFFNKYSSFAAVFSKDRGCCDSI